MEFLLQLMAELFNTDAKQSELAPVAQRTNMETINCSVSVEDFESETEIPIEEGIIFDFIRFH